MTGYSEVNNFCWTHFRAEIQNYALSYMMGDNEGISDATADAWQFLTEHVDVVGDDASGEDICVAATDFFAKPATKEAAEAQYEAEGRRPRGASHTRGRSRRRSCAGTVAGADRADEDTQEGQCAW